MKRTILSLSAATMALGFGMASAQTQSGNGMSEFDTDQSGDVSAEEFGAGTSGSDSFGSYDSDQSGSLSADEFSQGEFRRADRNADQNIDEAEFNANNETRGGAAAGGNMSDYDTDADNMLNQEEAGSMFGDQNATGPGTYSDYDTDQSGDVSQEEFSQGEFRRYDTDQDQSWNDEEAGRYSEDRARMSGSAGGSGNASGLSE